jgi:3-deoxy-D-manno-octulosonic acid (KDO) 8-phosphate synthase
MAPYQREVVLSQCYSHSFNPALPADDEHNTELCYQVEKTVNTLHVKIGQYLTPNEVQALIDAQVHTTIQPVKG